MTDTTTTAARSAFTPPCRRPLTAAQATKADRSTWGLYDDHGRRIATISNKIANQKAYAVSLAAAPAMHEALRLAGGWFTRERLRCANMLRSEVPDGLIEASNVVLDALAQADGRDGE